MRPGFLVSPSNGIKSMCGRPELLSIESGNAGEQPQQHGAKAAIRAPALLFWLLGTSGRLKREGGAYSTSTAGNRGGTWKAAFASAENSQAERGA